MTKKIFRSTLLAAGSVLAAALVFILGCLYDYFAGVQKSQLQDELVLASAAVQYGGEQALSELPAERYRLTWIAQDGTVLYDTQTDAASMENHASRTEVQQALQYGIGESTRYSSTLLEKTLYQAKALPDGSVLRISIAGATVGLLLLGMLQPILVVLALALALCALLARRLAKQIVQPLSNLDLEHPLENNTYEELAPLLGRIHQQHQQIDAQLRLLRQKTDEFDQTIRSMQEGLVLLDQNSKILSLNPAASRIFSAGDNAVGSDFLTLDRSRETEEAIARAQQEGHSELCLVRGERSYQMDLSRIDSEGSMLGIVLLIFDITAQEAAERSRREFTANVSHELKTPLQSIIGSAELLEQGLVKPEDTARFVGHIRQEATRLVALIEDIIRLSELDEGAAPAKEPVDLLSLGQEVAAALQPAAQARQITLRVCGSSATLTGVRQLLYEILFNLCDNAIKYNKDGGSVTLTVDETEQAARVQVQDTGIGIPPEHQARIFERFYRVDKSHSRASGGTGLGLSIVKHAVQVHQGSLDLQSTPGVGTTITVTFPK